MPAETPEKPSDPREKKRFYFENTPVRRAVTASMAGFLHLCSTWEAKGVENLPGAGAVVLAANHVTELDVFYMQIALPRLIFFMGKADLFRNPALDTLLRQLGGFPIERGARDEWALAHARQVLDRGLVLGIFPEGKRNFGRGLHAAKTGAARLAIAAQCPIVPMAVLGTHSVFQRWPRRARVELELGQPIHPEPDELALSLTDRLMFTLAEMLPPDQRGVYAERPRGF